MGRRSQEGLVAYCSAKFAVEGLTQTAALEAIYPFKTYTLDPRDGIQTEMLLKCVSKDYYETCLKPKEWAEEAYNYIIKILPNYPNGSSLTLGD